MKDEYIADGWELKETGFGGQVRYGNSIFKTPSGKVDKHILNKWKKAFIEAADPTEYRFALETVGDWEEYEYIKSNSKILRDELVKWHRELEVKIRSDALSTLVRDSTTDDSKSAPSSAKWLEEKLSKVDASRAKSTKEEKKIRDDDTLSNVTSIYKKIQNRKG